ncbi:hypothetical protein CANINC_002475 [Pichia inconspicua]|uniref:Uncharacterized protein n=1 Tax=Pichia inconspicua TaxID=52247 RepID=A0A4T0X2F3_9ASCO|nr:hypothetical protein CANINC_002475 [[Candida] inconspicua]
MSWDKKIGFIDAVINWLKEFEVLGVSKQGKISYFFSPLFLNHVLAVLLDVNDKVDSPRGAQTLNKQISTLKKLPIEHFLDIVSTEFNPINELRESNLNGSEDGKSDLKGSNLEILNKFLESVDIELLCAWTDNTAEDTYDVHTLGSSVYKNAKNIFKSMSFLDSKEENSKTAKDLLMYDKKMPRDLMSDVKAIYEMHNMRLDELLSFIDQLYIYMSVLFCIGIFSKRGALGLVQTNYLSDESKSYLKLWCKDVDYHYIDLGEIEDFEEAKSAMSMNLESALGKSAGWLNVMGETVSAERIVFKELEDVKVKCKQLSTVNLKLLNDREELGVKNESLLSIVDKLGKEIETFETKLTEKCKVETSLNEEKTELVQEHKESESRLRDVIKELRTEKSKLIEMHESVVEGLNCRIELLKENSKADNSLAEKRIEELHKVYKETIKELEDKITELKFEKDAINEQETIVELQNKVANLNTVLKLKEKYYETKDKVLKSKEADLKKQKQSIDQQNVLVKSYITKFNNDCKLWKRRFKSSSQIEEGSNSSLNNILALNSNLTNRSDLSDSIKICEGNVLSSKDCDIDTLEKTKAELKSMFDIVKTSMNTKLDDGTNLLYVKANKIEREVESIKHNQENKSLVLKDMVFMFENKLSLLENKVIDIGDYNSNKNSCLFDKSSTNNSKIIRECFNVKQLIDRYNNKSIDKIELKLIIKKNDELLYEDPMGKIYDFKEYDDFETIKIVLPLKFIIDLMTVDDNFEDIKGLYKEEMNKLLIRHRKLKDCCKVQRERCIKYNEMIKEQIKEDKKVLDWVISLNDKVNHIREVIERKVKESRDENIMQKFEQFMKIFVPFPIKGVDDNVDELN